MILFLAGQALADSTVKISGLIHRGNGDIFPGELAFTDKRIVSVRRVPQDNIDTAFHITPLMIDLNGRLYPAEEAEDSLMISRGMGMCLTYQPPYVILKTVRNLQPPDTLGLLISVPSSEGRIHALYQKIYDSLASDSVMTFQADMQNLFTMDKRLWWNNIPGQWIPDFNALTRKYAYENTWIVRDGTLKKEMVFENVRMIISYETLRNYEEGRPAESDWLETLGNAGIRFPEKWTYAMDDSIFEYHEIPREIFLQLVTVLPAEFFGMDNRFGLLVPGYSASFSVFKRTHGEKKTLRLEHLVVEGVYVK